MRRHASSRTETRPRRTHVLAFAAFLSFVGLTSSTLLGASGCKEDTSLFPREDTFARQIEGKVWAGAETVVGANVHVEAVPGYAYDDERRDAGAAFNGYAGVFTTTDRAGRYHVPDGPFAYDVWIRNAQQVSILSNFLPRYVEPAAFADGPLTGFRARVNATITPAPAAGRSIAYFVAGEDAKMSSPSNDGATTASDTPLDVFFAAYSSTVTLWAVEYETALGLTAPTRFGNIDVRLTSDGSASVVVPVQIIDDAVASDVTIDAVAPPGTTITQAELLVDFGVRRQLTPIARFTPGTPFHVKVAIGGRYAARVVATNGLGASSDSGFAYFNIFASSFGVTLPTPLPDVSFDGERTVTAGTQHGLVEHVFVPQPGNAGPTVRLLTNDRAATLPGDLRLIGVSQPTGAYAWSVTYYPLVEKPYAFAGPDIRYVTPLSTTTPQIIQLR